MSHEFVPQNSSEIMNLILNSGQGRTVEQFANMVELIKQAEANGVIRGKISCWETKEKWFDMAYRMYVNDGKPKMSDAEIGIHLGGCNCPTCKTLLTSYYQVLRFSQPEDSEKIAEHLHELRTQLIAGTVRPDLIGQPSEITDIHTGLGLPITHAVDISHHTLLAKNEKGLLIYTKPPHNRGVIIQAQKEKGLKSFSTLLDGGFLTPTTERFIQQADDMRIDTGILYDMVYANAPAVLL